MPVYISKNPTKDGRKYFFRIKYKDIFGEVHDYSSQKFKALKEAKEEEARYRIKIANQVICTSNVTVEKIYQELRIQKSKKLKKQSILKNDKYFLHLKPIHNKKINDINIEVFNKLSCYIESKKFSPNYNNKILGLFKQIIIYSNKYYNTNDSILKFVENYKEIDKIKKEMDFFTLEEYKKFDNVINEFKYHVFFELLYYNGLRKGEAQALNWKDIDFNKKEVNINKTLTTKIKGENWTITSPKTKNSIRVLPLIDHLVEDLKTLKKDAMKFTDFKEDWFVFGNVHPFSETTITNKKNEYCKLADLKQIRVHDFRHSCASLLINQGASIALVSKYLGHSNITMTLNTYTHMYKSELNDISDLLNKI